MNRHPSSKGSASIDKLVAAGLALLGETGHGGVTVRAVAARAGFSVAAVQHHFPSKERLLAAVYAQALAEDADAAVALTHALGTQAADSAAALRVLGGLLAINCGAAAARTAARNEALLGAARRRIPQRLVRRWRARRQAGLATLLTGLTPQPRAAARTVLELLVGIELVSLGCRTHPLTPQLNAEVLGYVLAATLGDARAHSPGWLEPIVAEAVRQERERRAAAPTGRDRGARAKVLDAAARVLCEQGASALNHRSVARQAETALSVVTYHFRTKADLLYGTFQHIRAEVTRFSLAANPASAAQQATVPPAIIELTFGDAPSYLGMIEASIAAATDAELSGFAWNTRILSGIYHLLLERPEDYRFDAAAFDRFAFVAWLNGAALLAQASWKPGCTGSLLHSRLAWINSHLPTACSANGLTE